MFAVYKNGKCAHKTHTMRDTSPMIRKGAVIQTLTIDSHAICTKPWIVHCLLSNGFLSNSCASFGSKIYYKPLRNKIYNVRDFPQHFSAALMKIKNNQKHVAVCLNAFVVCAQRTYGTPVNLLALFFNVETLFMPNPPFVVVFFRLHLSQSNATARSLNYRRLSVTSTVSSYSVAFFS